MRVGLKSRGQTRGKVYIPRHGGASKTATHRCEKQEETRERRRGKAESNDF